ncbi:MAG: carboxypeptidase-like regulatory domain-containing protein [Pirellulales bacterium]|jgi:hypothetical protein|nr:carboxypeptidase-like regulatory domain-containing protein [Thermoguttaceae bacterium]MDD4788462.1 carboxypeptidase-like regulatory domain-containing protein [Pirellulales bacterium]NLZ02262.1 carboxypeptidase regulatory-like domain-containing protein [Pirellulaceae bacterium]
MCDPERRRFVAALALLLVGGMIGCGGQHGLVTVSGTATHDGKPVEDLLVVFKPENGRISSGKTDAQGRFTLLYTRDEEGVEKGKHQVYVQYAPSDMEMQIAIEQGKAKIPPEVSEVVAKYGNPDKSPLTFDIQQSQEIDLKLD